jgi:hypothetical protein
MQRYCHDQNSLLKIANTLYSESRDLKQCSSIINAAYVKHSIRMEEAKPYEFNEIFNCLKRKVGGKRGCNWNLLINQCCGYEVLDV